tara:strand:- start:4634 stop:5884 length:1251 start_codon:yes stop_codon:yes gene_type:complete
MEVLKIATGGSVDDGKSTLIGRLLYDTKSLPEDKLAAIKKTSKQKGYDYLDFSLATDGLVAEREQGITIDVAHIYFSTLKKSYIIADAPGHVEYTRNMVTGASTSQVAIILIDARKGVVEQTKRHFFINNLLRIKDVIVAINKMDLVNYRKERYDEIKQHFNELIENRAYKDQNISFIPVSALHGENVVNPSKKMPWYTGPTLLEHLENLDQNALYNAGKTRFPVQNVIRPKTSEFHDFRGYAGKLYGGDLKVGDEVLVYPSLTKTKIKEIFFYKQKYEVATNRTSVTVTLEDDVNVSRGDMLVKVDELPTVNRKITATLCWLNTQELLPGKVYKLQHGVNKVLAKVATINHVIKTDFSGIVEGVDRLKMNDMGLISLHLNKSIYYDTFKNNRANGSFILIDNQTNNTVGVGFIEK